MTDSLNALPRRLLLGALLLGAAGCAQKVAVDAPPHSVVFFTQYSADLDDDAHQVVNQVVSDAAANPSRNVVVEGYADSIGTPGTNRTLSQLRAQVVADALVTGGVNRGRIVLHPRGHTNSDPGVESRRVDVSFGR